MALDPNTVGSWGLGPLGTPLGASSVSTAPLANPSTLTPEQVAQMRQHAMALQQPPEGGIHHWTQGLAELVRAIQGNREADFARQAEMAGRQQGAEAIGQIYAPYLSPGGGTSPPAAGAAPAGTLGSGPAGAIPSSGDQPSATTTADASAPRGIRNNNPLNIEDGQFARSQPGYAGSDGRFAKFEAPEHGVAAASTLLDSYQRNHGLNTISGIVNRWAPASDHNNTKAYAEHVAAQMGIGPNDPIPPEMRPQLIAAMARHENGVPLAATPAKTVPAATGLLAPIPSPVAPQASAAAPTRLAYAGNPPPGMIPNAGTQGALPNLITQGTSGPAVPPPSVFDTGVAPVTPSPMSPMVNAIAGRQAPNVPPGGVPWNPDDFKRQVAAMEAAKQSVPQTSTDIGGGELRPTQSPSLAEKPLNPIEQQMMALVRPQPNDDFARQAAAMEAAKGPPVHPADESSIGGGPVRTPNLFGPNATPVTPAEQAMMALVRPGAIPNTPAVPATAPDSAAPVPPISGRVPLPMPRPAMPLPTGSAIPGAVGPTSVGGAPLVEPPLPPPFGPVSTNGKQLPQGAGLPPATLVNAIAGRPMPAAGGDAGAPAPAAGGGAPAPAAPIQVAQNGPPTGGAPTGAGGPPGLPQPLTSPVGQINPQQLTQMLANPWVPDSAKAAMLQMIQQRGQPQSMPVEGGTLMFNAAGQKVFIPEPKFGTVKIGSAEIPTVSHFDPATRQWQTTTLSPGGGVQSTGAPPSSGGGDMPHPAAAQPDLSTIGGIQAAEAAQAGAKKAAETGGEATAKYYDSLHKGLAGSAMIAAQQKQNIDMLRQVAATPNFTPGAGSEAALGLQRLAAQFGINPEGAAPREIFNQVATRILADQISGIKSMASETGETGGKIFKSMLEMEEKANITPEDTASGVNAKINIIDQAGNLMMKWGDMADDYVAKHGKLDAGFDKTLRGEISKARIPDIVPKAAAVPSAPSEVSGLEAEMRRRGLLKDQPATAPVSQ